MLSYARIKNQIVIILFVLCPVAALPFFQPTGTMHRTATDLYGMVLLLSVGCILFLPKKEFKINAVDILVGCFLMISCIQPELKFDMFACMKNMSLMLGYVAFRMLPDKAIAGLLATVVISCLMQSVYGFMQYIDDSELWYTRFRLTGSFANPAHLAFLLSTGMIIAVSMFLFPQHYSSIFPFGKKRIFQILALVSALWLAFVLALTESRTAWAGTFVSVSLLLYMRYAYDIKRWRLPRFIWTAGVTIVLCAFCIGGYALYHYKKDSADGRLLIWKVTAEKMIGSKPVAGNGNGTFRSDYLYAQAAYFAEHPDAPERLLADNTLRPFNEYMRIGYEHGMVGLLLIAVTGYLVLRPKRGTWRPELKAILTAAAAISCFSYPSEIWCIKVYWLMTLALLAKTLPPVSIVHRMTPVRCIYALCWIITITGIMFYVRHVYEMRQVTGKQKTENAAKIFAAAYPTLHRNSEYLIRYVSILKRDGKTEETIMQMEALARLQPSTGLFIDMGDVHLKERRYTEAERCYRMAHHMTPARFIPLQRLMEMYVENGQNEKAVEIAEIIVRQPVKVKSNITEQITKEAIDLLKNQKNEN